MGRSRHTKPLAGVGRPRYRGYTRFQKDCPKLGFNPTLILWRLHTPEGCQRQAGGETSKASENPRYQKRSSFAKEACRR
jgi:hypothetical protein